MTVLALDQGTTSSRAVLFDSNGKLLCQQSLSIKQYYPCPGWVEHDPDEILASVLKCADEVLSKGYEAPASIGITNQRETVIAWNKESGDAVCNALVWQCRRSAPLCQHLIDEGFDEYIKGSTGLSVDAYFSATKIRWILDNIPMARALADDGKLLVGTVESWLIWKLTGNHLTDITNASRTMLFNINTLEWDKRICERLGIPESVLPEVVDNCYDFGRIRSDNKIPESLWGIPINAAVGDQQAALFGQQCFNTGDVKNTYGTGCFTLMNIGSDIRIGNKLLTTVAFKIGDRINYAIEGSVFNAGSSIQWLRDELKLIESAPECDVLAQSVPDNGGLVFVSAFTGLGAPYWDMYARGSFLGITRGSTKAHMCRAVLEGIAFQVAELVETMESETGCNISVLKVDGGASVSDIMMQFQSDIISCPVDRPRCVESTALGAAYMSGIASGIWSFDSIAQKRECDRMFYPEKDENAVNKLITRWKNAISAVRSFPGTED